MKLEDFNYLFIKTLNVNIRVALSSIEINEDNSTQENYQYLFKQAILSQSDMEDLLENINAVANEVTIFDNPEDDQDYLTYEQLVKARRSIERAFQSLLYSYQYQQFKDDFVKTVSSDDEITYQRFIFEDKNELTDEIYKVMITFDNDLFADEPFLPIKPGSIVNHYTKIKY